MQLLEAFRHFLFPFDQEVLETPIMIEEPTPYGKKVVASLPQKSRDSHEFIASDSLLYLNNL